jgi:hypothetical protein
MKVTIGYSKRLEEFPAVRKMEVHYNSLILEFDDGRELTVPFTDPQGQPYIEVEDK